MHRLEIAVLESEASAFDEMRPSDAVEQTAVGRIAQLFHTVQPVGGLGVGIESGSITSIVSCSKGRRLPAAGALSSAQLQWQSICSSGSCNIINIISSSSFFHVSCSNSSSAAAPASTTRFSVSSFSVSDKRLHPQRHACACGAFIVNSSAR
jgi:hypothetical protein